MGRPRPEVELAEAQESVGDPDGLRGRLPDYQVRRDDQALATHWRTGKTCHAELQPLDRPRLGYALAPDSTGWLEVWVDGVNIYPRKSRPTMWTGDTGQYLKYRLVQAG